MSETLEVFGAILMFAFGLFTLLAGLFTAYFGAGKSRAIGFTLIVIGIVFLALFSALTWDLTNMVSPAFDSRNVTFGLMGLLGSAVGAIAAVVVFLIAIMKA